MTWLSTWLSRPKVKLALIVNGFYFICLLTPAAPPVRSWFFPRPEAPAAPKVPPAYAPLAPPSSEPPQAMTYTMKEDSQMDVFLTKDLTLVGTPAHTLLLSPTFTTSLNGMEPPRPVLLRFAAYSNEQFYTDLTPLLISADGVYKWDDSAQTALNLTRTNTGRHSVTRAPGGVYIESVGVEVPYQTFLEIANGHRVIVELGPDTVALNDDQIAALRDMARRLPRTPNDPPPLAPPAAETGRSFRVGEGPVIVKTDPETKIPAKRH